MANASDQEPNEYSPCSIEDRFIILNLEGHPLS